MVTFYYALYNEIYDNPLRGCSFYFGCISCNMWYYEPLNKYNYKESTIEDIKGNLCKLEKSFKKFKNLDELLLYMLNYGKHPIGQYQIVKVTIENDEGGIVELVGNSYDVLIDHFVSLYPSKIVDNIIDSIRVILNRNIPLTDFRGHILSKYLELERKEKKKLQATIDELQLALAYHPGGTKAKELESHFLSLLQSHVAESK